MAQAVPTLLCRPENVTVKNAFDGHEGPEGHDSDPDPGRRYASCPDASPSPSETTAGESVADTPGSTLTDSTCTRIPCTFPNLEAVKNTFIDLKEESEDLTPKGPRNHTWGPTRSRRVSSSTESKGDTPRNSRGDGLVTVEQWPEYPSCPSAVPVPARQGPQVAWSAPANSANHRNPMGPMNSVTPMGSMSQPMAHAINLCHALPTGTVGYPGLPGMLPGLVPQTHPGLYSAPFQPVPPSVPAVPWMHVDPVAYAQQQAAMSVAQSVAMTAASLCNVLASPALAPPVLAPHMMYPGSPQPLQGPPLTPLPHQHLAHVSRPSETLRGASLESLEAEQEDVVEADATEKKHRPRRSRLWAHIYLRMQLDGFDLVPRLIGRKGCNMRRIAEETSAKVRIRGQGSGHLEIDGKHEAPTPLMIAVTTDHADPEKFKQAVQMTMKVLRAVEGCFHAFCARKGIEHVGQCYYLGMLQPNAQEALGSMLDNIPQNLEQGPAQTAPLTAQRCQ